MIAAAHQTSGRRLHFAQPGEDEADGDQPANRQRQSADKIAVTQQADERRDEIKLQRRGVTVLEIADEQTISVHQQIVVVDPHRSVTGLPNRAGGHGGDGLIIPQRIVTQPGEKQDDRTNEDDNRCRARG